MNKYYTVDQIAELLSMHPKTIQRYIREEKLKAKKIGKSWHISERDLKEFTANSSSEKEDVTQAQDKTLVSTVVDIHVQDSEEAANIERLLVASLNSKSKEFGRTTMHVQFLEYENILRVTLWGNLQFTQKIFEVISVVTEREEK